jgi:hypothetical protein
MSDIHDYILIVLIFITISCSRKGNYSQEKEEIAAFVDTIPIRLKEVDIKIEQEIFDELNRIYLIRKIALEEILAEKIISLEANRRNLSVKSFIELLSIKGEKDGKLSSFIARNGYTNGIPVYERTINTYQLESPKGKTVLKKKFEEYLIKQLVDSLKPIYKTKTILTPPVSPLFNTEKILAHYKGNLNSNVTLIVLSDFECNMCREFNSVYDSIYQKYKDKIKFGFSNFGSYVTYSALASESAANQNMFWEMHDFMFSLNSIPDTSRIMIIAKNLGLNMELFREDYNSQKLKTDIEKNLFYLANNGIYATPTLLIDNHVVFNSSSILEITRFLENELSKK